VRKYQFYNTHTGKAMVIEWATGFFVGQDSNLRLVLFGVVLMRH